MIPEGKNILIISNEPWGEIWFSKHNYAYELSKRNRVFFINPAPSWTITGLFSRNIILREERPGLFIISYRNFLPHLFLHWNNRVISRALSKKLAEVGADETLFWSFDPVRLFEPRLLNATCSLFEAVDQYRLSLKAESYLYGNVDMIVVIADSFRNFYAPFKKPVLTVSHAISGEEFTLNPGDEPKDIPQEKYILFAGNIDHRIDYDLLLQMVQALPQYLFLFIGGIVPQNHAAFEELFVKKKHKNLLYAGKKHFKQVKYYISRAEMCIAPMAKFSSNTISHHKIFQYLAFGKPVFSCVFSEYLGKQQLLYMENDNRQLVDKMNTLVNKGEPESLKEERIKWAREHTFDTVLSSIGDFISANCTGTQNH